MTEEPKKVSEKKIATGFLTGIIAGVIAGLLLAPKEGKEIREDLRKISQKIWKRVAKKTGEFGKLTKAEYEKIIKEVSDFFKKAKK